MTWRNTEVECERVVADLAAMMTTREKAGQLVAQAMPPTDDREAIRALEYEICEGRVGSVIGVSEWEVASRLQELAQQESRLGIPLLFPGEIGDGLDTVFPAPLTMAASWDLEAIRKAEQIKAFEARGRGLNWSLGPKVELSSGHDHPGSSSGSDIFLAAEIAAARINGLQTPDRWGDEALLACLELSQQSLRGESEAYEVLRLVQAIFSKARVGSVALDPEDRLGEEEYRSLVAFLRRPGAYDGLILPLGDKISRGIAPNDRAARWDTMAFEGVMTVVQNGTLPKRGLDEAVNRLLRAKFRLGLLGVLHAPRATTSTGNCATPTLNCESALQYAKRCPILLRNSTDLLPLDIEPAGILVVGSAAQDRRIPVSGGGIATSVIDGLERLGVPHRFVSGLALRGTADRPDTLIAADTMAISMACDAARRASTVIFVPSLASERTLGEASETLLRHLLNANPRLVLVTIGPVPIDPHVEGQPLPCVLHAGQLGTMSGHAIAELLVGEAAPVGRLPLSLPPTEEEPGLPFGHGLSYSRFELSDLRVNGSGTQITVTVTITNMSDIDGEQLVQLYLRNPVDEQHDRMVRLAGFKRVLVPARDQAFVEIPIEASELGTYDTAGKLSVEPGRREIFVGFNSVQGVRRLIAIPEEVARTIADRSRTVNLI